MATLERTIAVALRLGARPHDDDQTRWQKTAIVASVWCGLGVLAAWGALYLVFGELIAGSILVAHGALAGWSLARFARGDGSFPRFLLAQSTLLFVSPVAVTFALGGLVDSSMIISWGFLAAITTLVVGSTRAATTWFLALVVLVPIAGLLQPWLRTGNGIPPGIRTILAALNLIGPAAFAFAVLRYAVARKALLIRDLATERARSDALLLNILPGEIAAALRAGESTIAEHHDEVTVLFADIAGFTPMSATMTPDETVELLNEVFSAFDRIAASHGVEKIKTIGDCYMVAAGVPQPRDDHAEALTRMAIDMHELMRTRRFGGRRLSLRIGLNSGPVVAGVIGRSKFSYDVWGDTVNLASRMESHGVPGVVQVTASTYARIGGSFECRAQGTIEVKGKGAVAVWHVRGTDADEPAAVTASGPEKSPLARAFSSTGCETVT